MYQGRTAAESGLVFGEILPVDLRVPVIPYSDYIGMNHRLSV